MTFNNFRHNEDVQFLYWYYIRPFLATMVPIAVTALAVWLASYLLYLVTGSEVFSLAGTAVLMGIVCWRAEERSPTGDIRDLEHGFVCAIAAIAAFIVTMFV